MNSRYLGSMTNKNCQLDLKGDGPFLLRTDPNRKFH